MSSLITNSSAMNALSTLRSINKDLESTQGRIGSGLKISSAKDNAAYFSISESMKGDSGTYAAIDEGLTLTKNSVTTARMGAETIKDLGKQFLDKVAFAQGAKGGFEEIEGDLKELVKQMKTTLSQSTFNGDDMVGAGATVAVDADDAEAHEKIGIVYGELKDADGNAVNDADGNAVSGFFFNVTGDSTVKDSADADVPAATTRKVVTGITRAGGEYGVTTIDVETVDLAKLVNDFEKIAENFKTNSSKSGAGENDGSAFLAAAVKAANSTYESTVTAATKLGQSEKSIENQQDFLKKVTDNIDTGVGAMIDADMEEEAARLQALQVQQQLATQTLSIANQGPQNLLSLFQ